MQFAGIAVRASEVTPDDEDLLGPTTGLYVGATGDVTVVFAFDASNTPVTFVDVPTGMFMPIAVKQVHATGTTASDIVALYDS